MVGNELNVRLTMRNAMYICCIIIHQIFFARAIGLNTSRDAAKTGEYYTLNVWSRGKQLVLFSREKTKLTSFPRDQTLSALLYIQRMNKFKKRTKKKLR